MKGMDRRRGYSQEFGVLAPEAGWTPPIRYLLRRDRILRSLRKQPCGSLLEIGCGAGALLCDLTRLGYSACGLETSTEALSIAPRIARIAGSAHEVFPTVQPGWEESFDVVCAFDVLEHIEEDAAALHEWMRWLKPGGAMLLSVPAHRSRWGAGDIWAGHYRRYDKEDILKLVDACGLQVTEFECYGFPLANCTEFFGNIAYRRMIKLRADQSKEQATASSGVDRRSYARLSGLIGSHAGRGGLAVAMWLQAMTRQMDWGSGYLLAARRR